MFMLTGCETFSQEIKRSRFLAVAGPVVDEAAAKEFIAAHGEAAANHNCWAWRIGAAYRFGDDGEPAGTAGKPILQAIDGQKLDNAVVVVTRWFGGILLGSGGLIRAYGGTAAACLRAAEKRAVVATLTARIDCPFADHARVRARLAAMPDAEVTAETFHATGAEMAVRVPEARAAEVARLVTDITSGRARVDVI